MSQIVIEDLSKVYADGTEAVSHLSLDIADEEFMVLVGPSGCGKTTALRMVAGLEDMTSGSVRIGDRLVNDLSPKDRDVAMVFQNYALYPHMNVYDNMAFSLKLRRADKAEIDKRVHEAARILGLDQLLNKKPRNLSGGQRQRVAMGRAIVREPKAFLMDEPLSNLDAKLRVQMRAEIARIQASLGVTTIYVTHDQIEAMTLGDRVAVMKKGLLQQVDASQTLYEHPVNLFVAGFIGSPAMNMVEADLKRIEQNWVVEFGGHTLGLDESVLAARPALHLFEGRRVILGIRPEDFEDEQVLGEVPPGRTIEARVDLIEALGSEVMAHFTVGAPPVLTEDVKELAIDMGAEHLDRIVSDAERGTSVFVASLSPKTRVREGDRLKLFVDTARAHFFDPSSGLGIYTE